MQTELVILDMAGTTVHDRGNVAAAFINAFKENGLRVAETDVKKVMGWRKKDAIRTLLENHHPTELAKHESIIEKIHDTFIRNMIEFYENDTELKPLPHAAELFKSFRERGLKVALNTGFTRAITNTILKRLNWAPGVNLDAVIASDEVERGRPYPDMIQTLMRNLQVKDSAHVVKIGDTEVDVQEGRNAGCGAVVSVTTGAYSREQLQLCKPDYIIDSLAELPALIP